ncbi:type I methionyl aminopeptidase [Pseudochryseolinea flava]|uniref:Methionine aminopeptidase n=1 Tax=Pseudochryseolinea flava TaxID=2059302 RepID=A0A364XWC7_9BACT|nr:type I methionyl aminopeptidase [Pseudochryseolinea flava]RAV98458.1 type I methionyl aminopeptidase [Pseudochryseolinea flava]
MSITKAYELVGMKAISDVVANTLREMIAHAKPGMTTKELDNFGGEKMMQSGARSAPNLTYNFPGHTCISVNSSFAHGIPSDKVILQEGDLINIDVSAELNGYWSDNGCSFVLGRDVHGHQKLIDTSKDILRKALMAIRDEVRISDVGGLIEDEARRAGYRVIRNLTGHGIGRSLHEAPKEIANYRNNQYKAKFKANSIVAVETFIATKSTMANTQRDGWTLVGNKGGFVAQHEHTLMVTKNAPEILTLANGIV